MLSYFFGIPPVLIFGATAAAALILFLIFRRVVLWYWKIDEISRTLREILAELRRQPPGDHGH